jgi:hypothetical protein
MMTLQGYVPPDVATASKGSKKSKKSKESKESKEKFNNLRSSSKKLRGSKKSKMASNKLISSKKSKKASNKLISSKASRKEKLKETMPKRTKKSLKYAHTHVDLGTLDEATLRRFDQAKSRRLCNDAAEFAVFHVQVSESLTGAAGGLRADVARFLKLDQENCGRALACWPALIMSAMPDLSCSPDRLDLMLESIAMMCLRNRGAGNAKHDFVEYSAGSGMVTLQNLIAGFNGVGLDKIYDRSQDNSTGPGLRLWINEFSLTKLGALTWFGTQCSSFTALCKKQSQRWAENSFLGDESKEFVKTGNMQMTITALLMLVSFLVENVAVLEQSAGSTMPKTPPLNVVLRFASAKRVVTWHGAFGAATAKPLQIWSNNAIIEKLRRKKPVGISGHLCSNGGDSGYSGIPRRLFGSQAYMPEFGRAVADMMRGAH